VNRLAIAIPLQNEHAWPLWVFRVVLNHNGGCQPIDGITHADRVRGKLLVAVKRDADFASQDERSDPFQRFAQDAHNLRQQRCRILPTIGITRRKPPGEKP
jgi:hypothetical protein